MKIDPLTPDSAALAELGRRLAEIRKQRGDSQQALATAAGLGVATVRRIEDGKDSRLGSWLRILRALHMVEGIDNLLPENFRSPMAEAKRTRKRRSKTTSGSDFVWGDKRR